MFMPKVNFSNDREFGRISRDGCPGEREEKSLLEKNSAAKPFPRLLSETLFAFHPLATLFPPPRQQPRSQVDKVVGNSTTETTGKGPSRSLFHQQVPFPPPTFSAEPKKVAKNVGVSFSIFGPLTRAILRVLQKNYLSPFHL